MFPRTGTGPGGRSGTAGAGGGAAAAALARAGRLAVGFAGAFARGAVAGFLFFGSGFLPAMDVTYGSRPGLGSQGEPDESGDLAKSPVKEISERFGQDGRFRGREVQDPEKLLEAPRFAHRSHLHPDLAGEALLRQAQRPLSGERHAVAGARNRRDVDPEGAIFHLAGSRQRQVLNRKSVV